MLWGIFLLLWGLFWEIVYFYHTLIWMKFHLYSIRHPSFRRHLWQRSSWWTWLCWEGLSLWTMLLPPGTVVLLLWLGPGGWEKTLFTVSLLVAGPVSLRWTDTQLLRLMQRLGTVAAKQWILQGLPLRYLRFLSTTLFRREPREAE
ncbi:MAG: hypothetical protein D6736_08900, partial [Nitrospinota bacterium]